MLEVFDQRSGGICQYLLRIVFIDYRTFLLLVPWVYYLSDSKQGYQHAVLKQLTEKTGFWCSLLSNNQPCTFKIILFCLSFFTLPFPPQIPFWPRMGEKAE